MNKVKDSKMIKNVMEDIQQHPSMMQGAHSVLFQNLLFFQSSFLNFELDFFLNFEFGLWCC
jgi:hypothetical protein